MAYNLYKVQINASVGSLQWVLLLHGIPLDRDALLFWLPMPHALEEVSKLNHWENYSAERRAWHEVMILKTPEWVEAYDDAIRTKRITPAGIS